MIKTVLKYVLFSLLFTVTLLIALLFIPPVTKSVLQKTLGYFLEVDANVTTASLTLGALNASGTLDQNDTFVLSAKALSLTSAVVNLHYDGNVHTFSNVATVELPYVATALDATFTTDNLFLALNASLLEGTLRADLSLEEWNYHYAVKHIDLSSFNSQQKEPLAGYATGQFSAKGSGIIEAPYTVDFFLQSHNLQAEKNATMLISSDIKSPLPLLLSINGSVGEDKLESNLSVKSPLIDLHAPSLLFDFNQSSFALNLTADNHNQDLAPIKQLALDLNGSIGQHDLNTSYILTADGYQLKTKKLRYDFNSSDLFLDYKLSSLANKPLNLTGKYSLYGDISYGNDNLSLLMNSKALNSPILLSLKENQLHLISNNMPLKTVQIMTNQEVIARGAMTLEADANLSSSPLLWNAKVQSKNLKLPWKYRKDIGLKNDLVLTLKANGEKNGDIVIRPTLWSNIAILNYTAVRYRPDSQLLFFNLNAKKIKTAYYRAPRLNLKGSLNLKKSRLNKTTLKTPYEKVVISNLHYSDKGVTSQIDFALSRLDRFAQLNRDYNLSGKSELHYTPQKTKVTLQTSTLGTLLFEQNKNAIKLSGKALPLEEITFLSDQPVLMKGKLDYHLRYSNASIKVDITSKQLSGYNDLNDSIRPFPLDFSSSLKYRESRYRGEAKLTTDNEDIKISNVVVDLSKNQMKSRYKLEVKELAESSYILPKELKGPLHINGDFEQNKFQHLTLNLIDFQLPKEWHQKLEANATTYLETNTSIQAYNDKGLISFDAEIDNKLLKLKLHKSDYNLKTGEFNLKSDLKTDLWLKDTNITATGKYDKKSLYLPKADITTAHETMSLENLRYVLKEQNLSTKYRLRLKPYAKASYHSKASIYGKIETKPKLYATMKSASLGGKLDAYVTDTDLHLTAKDVSIVKLVGFSGQDVPIVDGMLDAKIDLTSLSLLDSNLSDVKGTSDINISQMVLEGIVLDETLKTLKDSQDLNLFQGSFSDLPIIRTIKEIPSDLHGEKENQTRFGSMRFLTDINNSLLHCKDCAIATEKNLIAVQGDINLTSQTFHQFYVGLLFPTRCAYFIQQVEGNLSKPKVQLAAAGFNVVGGTAKSIASNIGSALDLGADLVKGTGTIIGSATQHVPIVGEKTDKAITSVTDAPKALSSKATECTPFYTGTVQHPIRVKRVR